MSLQISRSALKIIVVERQEARGKRHSCKSEEVFGDFTFLYTIWFYYVDLLTKIKLSKVLIDVRTIYPQLTL
ncbi:hypothetical protein FJR08_19610 [Dolichospermum sp. UHCC 0260]|nr:hypothetical protein [Dolichospermum sp. UHCC 0260]